MKTKCCSTCKNKRIRTTDEPCNTCITEYSYNGVLPSYTPRMTNADLIRAMSDEELAEWIERIRILCANDACGRACPLIDICYSKAVEPTETLGWLKQEAEEGET